MLKEYQDFYTLWIRHSGEVDVIILEDVPIYHLKLLAFIKARVILRRLDKDDAVIVRKCNKLSSSCLEWEFKR